MERRGFLQRHGIVRQAIRKDLIYFGLPAFVILLAGLIVSSLDGYDGLTKTLWDLVLHPQHLSLLTASEVTGLLLFLIGMIIAFTAVFTLRRFYSSTLVTRQGHRLITHGIYRFVRHPIYLGVLLVLIGAVPVFAASLYGLLVMSALIPIILNRIRMEERLLTEQFGDEYRAYAARTRKLIPFLY